MISSKIIVAGFSSLLVFSCSWLYYSHAFLSTGGLYESDVVPFQTNHEFHAPRVNSWAELSKVEFDDLLSFLYNRSEGLGSSKGARWAYSLFLH